MRQIVLALNILTIAVPKRKVFVVSRIYHLPHSFRKQKICFNQCRFLFQKLKIWKNKLTCGTKNQFQKEKVLPKPLKPNFPKRRRNETSSFRCISTATFSAKFIYNEHHLFYAKIGKASFRYSLCQYVNNTVISVH